MKQDGTMTWSDDMALTPLGERRFGAQVGDGWRSLQGVHGGVVAALAVTAAQHVLEAEGVDPATVLRAATFGYVAGNAVGDLEIAVDVVRRGRALVTTHAHVTQGGKTTTVARLHHSTPWEGPEYSDAPPMAACPADATPLPMGGMARHLDQVDTLLHPATRLFGGAGRAEWLAWCRPRNERTGSENTFGAAWLTMFGDYFPPAVFTRTTGPNRAVTIEYSIQIHAASSSWTLPPDARVAARMHAFHSHEGFAVEDGWIHLPDGTLLATTRQTRLAG